MSTSYSEYDCHKGNENADRIPGQIGRSQFEQPQNGSFSRIVEQSLQPHQPLAMSPIRVDPLIATTQQQSFRAFSVPVPTEPINLRYQPNPHYRPHPKVHYHQSLGNYDEEDGETLQFGRQRAYRPTRVVQVRIFAPTLCSSDPISQFCDGMLKRVFLDREAIAYYQARLQHYIFVPVVVAFLGPASLIILQCREEVKPG
ncbi:hypothetical protein BY996DRAFT_6426987 [Phakopsora pachyrhizi]|nr:hypothetical protein BY996DRAFT_6426987 [Phakopsora pachyrhizi]